MICQKEYTAGPELWLASETQHPTRAAGQGAGRPQVRWPSPYQSISARQSVLLVSASPSACTNKSGQSSDYLGVKERLSLASHGLGQMQAQWALAPSLQGSWCLPSTGLKHITRPMHLSVRMIHPLMGGVVLHQSVSPLGLTVSGDCALGMLLDWPFTSAYSRFWYQHSYFCLCFFHLLGACLPSCIMCTFT